MSSKSKRYYDSNPKAKKRKKAYDSAYQATDKQKKRRAKRNAARKKMMKKGLVKKGDGKDVDHVRGVGAGNGDKNLRVQSASKNRGRK